ncbi:hypothetical protein, partial [Mesorhizobium sp. M7D.F.Ca.US.004.03.1.1]|uniref:hypothetical protein n=1 Tax=Mesorhizobium sp. M7D.F.Ca.US.004.03.1.1 TaxID=2496702 RepID=UPI0019D112CD
TTSTTSATSICFQAAIGTPVGKTILPSTGFPKRSRRSEAIIRQEATPISRPYDNSPVTAHIKYT